MEPTVDYAALYEEAPWRKGKCPAIFYEAKIGDLEAEPIGEALRCSPADSAITNPCDAAAGHPGPHIYNPVAGERIRLAPFLPDGWMLDEEAAKQFKAYVDALT